MFKFDDYPEIKKAYKEYSRLTRISNTLIDKIQPDGKWRKESDEAFEELRKYEDNVFPLKVFEAFKDIKPMLYHQFKNRFEKWEKVFPDNWGECDDDHKANLMGLVLELSGYYWLPEEYYNKEPRHKGITDWPTCHTKPYKGY